VFFCACVLSAALLMAPSEGAAAWDAVAGGYGLTAINNGAFWKATVISDDATVVIPNEHLGKPVTLVDAASFARETLETLTIPENIRYISPPDSWFMEEDFPVNLETLYFNAVDCEPPLSTSGLYSIFAMAGQSSTAGFTVHIGKNVKAIPNELFYAATYLTKVVFEADSVCERIGDSAFQACYMLKEIENFPDTVREIGSGAFGHRNEYAETAKIVKTEDDVKYIGKVAVGLSDEITATAVELKAGTSGIAASAFSRAEITEITIPSSVTAIGDYAMAHCDFLERIIFADNDNSGALNLQKIGEYTFGSPEYTPTLWLIEQLDKAEEGSLTYVRHNGQPVICLGYKEFSGAGTDPAVVEVEAGTRLLANRPFGGGTKQLVLPESLVQLNRGAFDGVSYDNNLSVKRAEGHNGD